MFVAFVTNIRYGTGRRLAVITYQERGTSSLIVYQSPTQRKRPIEIKRPNPSLLCQNEFLIHANPKGWLAIAKLKPLSLFISLLLMLKKALDNGKMVK